jgi:hypothetical protein
MGNQGVRLSELLSQCKTHTVSVMCRLLFHTDGVATGLAKALVKLESQTGRPCLVQTCVPMKAARPRNCKRGEPPKHY